MKSIIKLLQKSNNSWRLHSLCSGDFYGHESLECQQQTLWQLHFQPGVSCEDSCPTWWDSQQGCSNSWHPHRIKLTIKKSSTFQLLMVSRLASKGKVFSRATIWVSSSEYSHRHWERLCTISSFRPWCFSKFSYPFLLMLLSHTGLPPPSSLFSVPSPLPQCLLGWLVLVYLSGSAGPTGP